MTIFKWEDIFIDHDKVLEYIKTIKIKNIKNRFNENEYEIRSMSLGATIKYQKIENTIVYRDKNFIILESKIEDALVTLYASLIQLDPENDDIISYSINNIKYKELNSEQFENIIKTNSNIVIKVEYTSEKDAKNYSSSLFYQLTEDKSERESQDVAYKNFIRE